jgi:hypothetical protein
MRTLNSTHITNKSIGRAGKTVGIGLAIMFVLGILADSVIMPKIIKWQDVLQTSNNIIANEQMFRIGIFSYWGDMLVNVLIAFALYILLKPVNNTLAILAAGFRLVYVIIRSTALINLVKVLDVIKPEGIVLSEISTKVMHLLEADKAGYSYALIFFGFHVLFTGYLIVKSGYIPKILGLLLIIAFIGYQVYCMAFIFDADFANRENMYKMILGIPGVISELSFCIWLLIKKIK